MAQRSVARRTVAAPGQFRISSCVRVRGVRSPNISVEADATAARGEEDEVLRQDRRALGLARCLAEALPGTDNPTLEVLARRQADSERQIYVEYEAKQGTYWDFGT